MEQKDNVFEYTYSAPQQNEVKMIRDKYLPKEESKIEQLRRLDKNVSRKPLACTLTLGIASSLILGIGMCLCMVLGELYMLPGIIIGICGIFGMAMSLPIYRHLLKRETERIAPTMLQLTEELLNGQA